MATPTIEPFDFPTGKVLRGKYVIENKIGGGWEGEVYKVSEIRTDITRAAKFYYPPRNPKGKTAVQYSRKLNRLSGCPIIMRYMHQDSITFRREKVDFLVSEFIEGKVLSHLINEQPGKRFTPFEALHILDALCSGLEQVHQLGEYHGDIHTDNILVQKKGIHYKVKLIDFYDWKGSRRENIFTDVVDLVRILYDMVGGRRHYSKAPPQIKVICKGLKPTLLRKQFRTAGQLRRFIHQLEW